MKKMICPYFRTKFSLYPMHSIQQHRVNLFQIKYYNGIHGGDSRGHNSHCLDSSNNLD